MKIRYKNKMKVKKPKRDWKEVKKELEAERLAYLKEKIDMDKVFLEWYDFEEAQEPFYERSLEDEE